MHNVANEGSKFILLVLHGSHSEDLLGVLRVVHYDGVAKSLVRIQR